MKIISYLIVIAFIFGGCSSTYQINSPADAQANLENKNGTILLRNGDEYEAERIRVHNDSLTFTSKNAKTDSSLLINDIKSVKRINRGKGAGNGALIGGATVFLPLMWTLSTNSVYHNVEEQNGNYLLYLILGAASLTGSGTGAMMGSRIGVHETFLFNSDTTSLEIAISEAAERDPLRVKHGFKVGIEWGGSFTHENRTYSVKPGYSIEYMGGVHLYRASHGSFHLGMEFGYLRLTEYDLIQTTPWIERFQYRTVTERRDVYSLIDFALLPEYTFSISEQWVGSIYGGFALPSGDRETRNTTISRVVIDSGYYHSPDYLTSPPPIGNPGVTCAGVRLYYNRLMFDLRYRRMTVSGRGSYDHFFAEAGFVL